MRRRARPGAGQGPVSRWSTRPSDRPGRRPLGCYASGADASGCPPPGDPLCPAAPFGPSRSGGRVQGSALAAGGLRHLAPNVDPLSIAAAHLREPPEPGGRRPEGRGCGRVRAVRPGLKTYRKSSRANGHLLCPAMAGMQLSVGYRTPSSASPCASRAPHLAPVVADSVLGVGCAVAVDVPTGHLMFAHRGVLVGSELWPGNGPPSSTSGANPALDCSASSC